MGIFVLPCFFTIKEYDTCPKISGANIARKILYMIANVTDMTVWIDCALGELQQSNFIAFSPIINELCNGFVNSPSNIHVMADICPAWMYRALVMYNDVTI